MDGQKGTDWLLYTLVECMMAKKSKLVIETIKPKMTPLSILLSP